MLGPEARVGQRVFLGCLGPTPGHSLTNSASWPMGGHEAAITRVIPVCGAITGLPISTPAHRYAGFGHVADQRSTTTCCRHLSADPATLAS
jgi:hypothetical protein